MSGSADKTLFERTFERIRSSQNVEEAIRIFQGEYAVLYVTYHLAQTVTGNVDAPFVRTTYPDQWVSRYLLRDYVKIDPVVQEGFLRQLPFEWSELIPSAKAQELMIDAIQHGVGMAGYSIPISDKAGRRALFSINYAAPDEAWSQMMGSHREDWAELAHLVHRKAVSELHGDEDPIPHLGPREIECLTWTARGKASKEIAILLGLSDNTTKAYLKSARFKLTCANLPEAVTKAIKLHIINP
jgi:DNA-binding CsgD family transcriptional regulator